MALVSRKAKPSPWCAELPWRVSVENPDDAVVNAAEVDAPTVAAEPHYYFSWDEETRQAFRQIAGSSFKEVASSIGKPDTAACGSKDAGDCENIHLVAHWEDGVAWSIPQLLVEDFDMLEGKRQSAVASASLWSGTHVLTGHQVRIVNAPQKDRGDLLILKEQGVRTIASLIKDLFGTEQEALDFFIRVATEYIEDRVERKDVTKKKAELLQELGIIKKRCRWKKADTIEQSSDHAPAVLKRPSMNAVWQEFDHNPEGQPIVNTGKKARKKHPSEKQSSTGASQVDSSLGSPPLSFREQMMNRMLGNAM